MADAEAGEVGRQAGRFGEAVTGVELQSIGARGDALAGSGFGVYLTVLLSVCILETVMVAAIIVLLLILLLLGGGGMVFHFLWYLLIAAVILWILGFFIRTAEGGGRWYNW